MTWYLVRRRNVIPPIEWTVGADELLSWLRRRHEDGSVLFSGPSADRTQGIYIVRARSLVEAEAIAATDPLTAAGFCSSEVVEWQVHQAFGFGPFTASQVAALAPE